MKLINLMMKMMVYLLCKLCQSLTELLHFEMDRTSIED